MKDAPDIDVLIDIWQNYDGRLQAGLLLLPTLEPIRDSITGILELSELLARTTRAESVRTLQRQFDKSLNLLLEGVRGLCRAGGEVVSLETLAERLEWGVK